MDRRDVPAREDGLLRQYEVYVQTAENVSHRRERTNRFFISLHSVLLAAVFSLARTLLNPTAPGEGGVLMALLLVTASVVGILWNALWLYMIRAYRILNDAKFAVIQEMENRLPCPCFQREWHHLKHRRYPTLTRVERGVVWVVFLVYGVMLLLGLFLGFQA